MSDGGSFTLVSGVLAYDPIVTGTVASVVNGALDAFVRAAAIALPRGQRINAVSATVFEEAWDAYGEYFPGHKPVATAEAARAYVAEVRDVTGFEVHLVRDPHKLPPRVHGGAARGLSIVPDNPQHIFIPVVRAGALVGAREMEKFGPRPGPWPWWRRAPSPCSSGRPWPPTSSPGSGRPGR